MCQLHRHCIGVFWMRYRERWSWVLLDQAPLGTPDVLGQRFSRSLSTSSRVHLQNRVLEKQKIFQADNNVPVHLKGGQGDLILYRITMGIAIVGCCLGIFTIGKASLPKKSP
ncbi:cytochrome c oxidase subunit 7A1, mitochondrial-like isoform X1 [Aquarana catesbeiana]|uniref:cytochrome c oxidase subunit 7A1, mitochondrial-like isoform X1 n=1 Tax=Aquarana catesbeiana TaxID=8400 RepID=UPI003CCA278D